MTLPVRLILPYTYYYKVIYTSIHTSIPNISLLVILVLEELRTLEGIIIEHCLQYWQLNAPRYHQYLKQNVFCTVFVISKSNFSNDLNFLPNYVVKIYG